MRGEGGGGSLEIVRLIFSGTKHSLCVCVCVCVCVRDKKEMSVFPEHKKP